MNPGEAYIRRANQYAASGDLAACERTLAEGLIWARRNQALHWVATFLYHRLSMRLVDGGDATLDEVREVAEAYREAGDPSGLMEALLDLAARFAFIRPTEALTILDEVDAFLAGTSPDQLTKPTPTTTLGRVEPNGVQTLAIPQAWPERVQAQRKWTQLFLR